MHKQGNSVWQQGIQWCAGDRKSRRARKGRAPVQVSAAETIRDLKLKIVQTLNVHPQNALIHIFRHGKWQLLGGDDDVALAGKAWSRISIFGVSCIKPNAASA